MLKYQLDTRLSPEVRIEDRMLRFVPEKPAETTVPFRSFMNETYPKSSRYASFRKFVAPLKTPPSRKAYF